MSYQFHNDNRRSLSSIDNNISNISNNFAGGTIINNNLNSNYIFSRDADSDVVKVENELRQHHVPGATFEAQPSDAGCMLGTRVKVLDDVFALLTSRTGPHIVWIAGMAGTGKTTIALTLCRTLWEDPTVFLGGTFFCSRSAGSVERTDARRIVPTLATLLARQFPAFAFSLANQLAETPDVAHWSVQSQVKRLIAQPLEALAQETYTGQIVFVIDALDECSDPSRLTELIDTIADFGFGLPVKFLLTSRPEMYIRRTSINDPVLSSILRLHTVDPEQVDADIQLYLVTKLARVVSTTTWYSTHDIEALVALSNGLFIFASTVLQYILYRDNDEGRRERLQKVTSVRTRSTTATTTLDQVYELVITEASRSDRVDSDELESMKRVLACVLTSRALLSVQALADLAGVTSSGIRCSLEHLHSLVYLPNEDTEPGVRTLHASFGDYMLDSAATHIRLAPSLGHDILAGGCLQRMAWPDLCFNISRSRSSYEPNAELLPDSISLSLVYACLQWAHHIDAASTRSAFDADVGGIFRRKFLFWLEVLSIAGKMNVASGLLRIAGSAVILQEVSQFLRDANSFVASSYAAIARSAPHIYLSAIPFAPKNSLIYRDFASLCTGVVSVETFGAEPLGSRLVMTLSGHEDDVNSVAYSPSGHRLVSGSSDGTLRVWDTWTGEEVISPLRNGDGAVWSVAFAPDGQRVVSGGEHGALCIWNVFTGILEAQRLLIHSQRVSFLTFSPDGKLVASISSNGTVSIWNVETGQITSARSDRGIATTTMISLSFSRDGMSLKLRSCYGEQLWHISTREPIPQLLPVHEDEATTHLLSPYSSKFTLSPGANSILLGETQTGRVATLPISPEDIVAARISADETCLVSSVDTHVNQRLWELRHIDNGDPPFIILGGHTDIVDDISFSPDGRFLATGSRDCTIRIWDASPGHDHVQRVEENSVDVMAVSPDDAFIVYGRSDGSIHVYDVTTAELRMPPITGHEASLYSVAISPDGQLIASGSVDNTVRLWLVETGDPIGGPLTGHRDSVRTVTFSSDTRWLASGSDDHTVLIWDVATRESIVLPPMLCDDRVRAVAFATNGRTIAAGDSRGNIYFWHTGTGQLHHTLTLDYRTDKLAFSPSGRWLAAGGESDLVRVWNSNTGELVYSIEDVAEYCNSVAWSPCERYIVVASNCRTVHLFDRAQDAVTKLQGHNSDWVTSVAFTSNKRCIISGALDGVIRLWDVEEARSLSSRVERHDTVATLASAMLDYGWLIGPSGELLLWVPGDYHGRLEILPYTTVFGNCRIAVKVGDRGLHWGNDWHACWRGAAEITV